MDDQGANTYFYSRVILLEERFCHTVTTTPQGLVDVTNQASAVLLFNFALTYHLESLRRFGNECVGLQQASTQIYNMALGLLEPIKSSTHSWPAVLMALVLNNCAQLHYAQCHYELSSTELNGLATLLSEEEQTFETSDLLSVQDLDSLTVNVVVLQPPSAAHAA